MNTNGLSPDNINQFIIDYNLEFEDVCNKGELDTYLLNLEIVMRWLAGKGTKQTETMKAIDDSAIIALLTPALQTYKAIQVKLPAMKKFIQKHCAINDINYSQYDDLFNYFL